MTRLVFCSLVVLFLFSSSVYAASPKEIAETLAQNTNEIRGLENGPALDTFYRARNYEPIWFDRGGLNRQGHVVYKAMIESWTHGLNPLKYNIRRLPALVKSDDTNLQAEAELLLSEGYVKYGRDMTGARIPMSELGIDGRYWQKPLSPGVLLSRAVSDRNFDGFLDILMPQDPLYNEMRRALSDLVLKGDGRQPQRKVSFEGRLLRQGDFDQGVPRLREKFGLQPQAGADPYVYDAELAQAVYDLQWRYGIKADGILGPQTLDLINKDGSDKLIQLVANLERMRWMPRVEPARLVVVNIPQAHLWAYEHGREKLSMPVVVGSGARKTESFITTITGVRFNPTWTVPETIKKEDYLPLLREDPYALREKGIEIGKYEVGGGVTPVAPASVDWSAVTEKQLDGFRMVQGAGSANPLGRIRILMPNQYAIFLHDTNHPDLFDRSQRTLSSGCIRVKEPQDLAMFILEPNPDWDASRMETYLERGKTIDIAADAPFPVYLLYNTVWVGPANDLVFGSDLYGLDSPLYDLIARYEGFAWPT